MVINCALFAHIDFGIFELCKGCEVGHRWTSCGSHDANNICRYADTSVAENIKFNDIQGQSFVKVQRVSKRYKIAVGAYSFRPQVSPFGL